MPPAPLPLALDTAASGLDALRANASFQPLSDAVLREWLAGCAHWNVQRGQELAGRGSVPDVCFGLLAGAIELSVQAPGGEPTVLDLAEPGHWFGIESLLLNRPLPFRVRTHTPAVLLVMRRSVLLDLHTWHPAVSPVLMDLSWRLSLRLLEQAERRAAPLLSTRLLDALRSLADRFGVAGDEDWTRITIELCQAELAALVGCSRQRVNAEIQQLRASGLVRVRGRSYELRGSPPTSPPGLPSRRQGGGTARQRRAAAGSCGTGAR